MLFHLLFIPNAVSETKKPTAVPGDGFRKLARDALKPNRRRS